MTSNARITAICVALVLLDAWVIFTFARNCMCDQCNRRFAIWTRFDLQLCRHCKTEQDRITSRIVRRRSLLRRIFRTAA